MVSNEFFGDFLDYSRSMDLRFQKVLVIVLERKRVFLYTIFHGPSKILGIQSFSTEVCRELLLLLQGESDLFLSGFGRALGRSALC